MVSRDQAGFRRIELTDQELDEINKMLDWHAGTLVDGRLLGRLGVKPGKREAPAAIPDYRIVELDRRLGLRGKSVLEVGCFEGIHTVGLRMFTEDVTAVDIRPTNVVKTLARLSFHGTWAKVFRADVEALGVEFGAFDLIFHCGVLYHLMAPVEHLIRIGPMCRFLFLDTHVARNEPNIETVEVAGAIFRAARHGEGGWVDPFSGKGPYGVWLTWDSLQAALVCAGFHYIDVIEHREERNGPRVALLATRR
ncbi:MAG TPA: DUF1698 domain-containing protein [Dehalococcoidia bacterium]|nr:DUF1698 domain-containing protein [Dehalococcoidia bacterium]